MPQRWFMKSAFIRILNRASMAYGPLLLLALYGTWWAGRLSLGHWPRPSLDDPKAIDGIKAPYFATGMMLLLLPAALLAPLAAMASVWLAPHAERKRTTVEALMALAGVVLTIAISRWDPHDVLAWFFD
jgi:hypothetical protein